MSSSDEESLAKVSEKEEPKPKPPPERRQIRRRDTFFDQKPVGPDYGSVIDSISHTTEQDLGDRHADFPDKKDSAYVARNPVGKELVLKDDDEGEAPSRKANIKVLYVTKSGVTSI